MFLEKSAENIFEKYSGLLLRLSYKFVTLHPRKKYRQYISKNTFIFLLKHIGDYDITMCGAILFFSIRRIDRLADRDSDSVKHHRNAAAYSGT